MSWGWYIDSYIIDHAPEISNSSLDEHGSACEHCAKRPARREIVKKAVSKRIIVGITGASGALYGVRSLQLLREKGFETHLIISEAGKQVMELETDSKVHEVEAMASRTYDDKDLTAPLASGSYLTGGMIIAPCTMKTLSGIANSYANSLIERAADVTLKEKRKLVLVVRETPLHKGHLRLMGQAADMGAHILPPIPAFYHKPITIEDIIDQTVGRILDYFGIEHGLFKRWGEKGGKKGRR
jgi:4-hydroxy-3-polyprenylbenzoate decarboxylase